MDGRVTFRGAMDDLARANMRLRTAERIYVKLGSFPARSFTELFDGVRALPFEDYIGGDDAFPVKGHSIKSDLHSIPDCQAIIKKAVVKKLSARYGISVFPEEGVKYQIEFFILNNEATLMIDTSGAPLHKRGYRRESNEAPIRETLAAAIAAISRPREDVLFWDPMCGSGTIAIEAAMKMKNIAPGVSRSFAAESFPFVSKEIWQRAREEAREGEVKTDFEVFASDISEPCVRLTERNARAAGVSDIIKVFNKDARKISAPGRRGTIVVNPPYGERMGNGAEVEKLYREIGEHFRSLPPWQVYIITSHPYFEKLYGKRADKVRKLYNGMLECRLYQFFKNK
jgi:putative N6-adenine-specific DNA methylase